MDGRSFTRTSKIKRKPVFPVRETNATERENKNKKPNPFFFILFHYLRLQIWKSVPWFLLHLLLPPLSLRPKQNYFWCCFGLVLKKFRKLKRLSTREDTELNLEHTHTHILPPSLKNRPNKTLLFSAHRNLLAITTR